LRRVGDGHAFKSRAGSATRRQLPEQRRPSTANTLNLRFTQTQAMTGDPHLLHAWLVILSIHDMIMCEPTKFAHVHSCVLLGMTMNTCRFVARSHANLPLRTDCHKNLIHMRFCAAWPRWHSYSANVRHAAVRSVIVTFDSHKGYIFPILRRSNMAWIIFFAWILKNAHFISIYRIWMWLGRALLHMFFSFANVRFEEGSPGNKPKTGNPGTKTWNVGLINVPSWEHHHPFCSNSK